MKFTKLEIAPTLSKAVASALPLYRKAPDNQKGGIRIQVSKRMEEMIKAQGKTYLEEEKAYANAVKKGVDEIKSTLAKSVADMKALQKLKHKAKNENEIKALHIRIDQAYAMGVGAVGNMSQWGEGLTAHQGWRGEVIPNDDDAKELLGKDEIERLDAMYKKIRVVGIDLIASVSTPKKQADEMLRRLETLTKAAAIAAKDLLGAQETEKFATDELDELEKPKGEITMIENKIHTVMGTMTDSIKYVEGFLKDVKDNKKKADKDKITEKDLQKQQSNRNSHIKAMDDYIKLMKSQNETIKATCEDIKNAAKKGGKDALSPDTVKRLTAALSKTKEYDKLLKDLEKDYSKYHKLVTKDLAKAKLKG